MKYSSQILKNIKRIVILFVFTIFNYILLALPLFLDDKSVLFENIFTNLPLFTTSIIILMIAFIPFLLLFDFKSSLYWYQVFYLTISVVNYFKVRILNEPLYPTALNMITNVSEFASMVSTKKLIIIVLLVFISVGVIGLVYFQYVKTSKNKLSLKSGLIRLLALFLLIGAYSFFLPKMLNIKNPDANFYKLSRSLGFRENRLVQTENFRINGPVFGYIYNMKTEIINKPESYSKEKMKQIYEKYSNEAMLINEVRATDSFENVDIYFILSESFSNPDNLEAVTMSDSPTKYVSDPSDKNLTSKFISPSYGSGTSGVEFEVLTGINTRLLNVGNKLPFQDFLPGFESFPSVVSRLQKTTDSELMAYHSYNSSFYKRIQNYKVLGFHQTFFEDSMEGYDGRLSDRYILDSELYRFVNNRVSLNKNEGQGTFNHILTMQNHSGYPNIYDSLSFDVELNDDNEKLETAISVYSEGISITDEATKLFIRELEESGNDYIVVFYGDHLPGIYGSLASNSSSPTEYKETEMMVVSNMSDEKIEQNHISPTSLETIMYQVAGVKINPFLALMQSINESFIVIDGGKFLVNGEIVEEAELDSESQELLEDYRNVMYDLLGGKSFLNEDFWN